MFFVRDEPYTAAYACAHEDIRPRARAKNSDANRPTGDRLRDDVLPSARVKAKARSHTPAGQMKTTAEMQR